MDDGYCGESDFHLEPGLCPKHAAPRLGIAYGTLCRWLRLGYRVEAGPGLLECGANRIGRIIPLGVLLANDR